MAPGRDGIVSLTRLATRCRRAKQWCGHDRWLILQDGERSQNEFDDECTRFVVRLEERRTLPLNRVLTRSDHARREIERDGLNTCGEVGYFDNTGYLYICDRKRDMVIPGGVNIYPAEIEAVVEPLDGYVLDAEVMRTSLRAHLAGYKVPRSVEIRRDLPREDSGKIFKRRLREPFWLSAGRAI